MNCKEIKYFLLGCENPDRPPAEVKAHLAICAGCQDWQNRLAVIEMNVPFLPVPDSAVRAQLLRTVRSQPVPVRGETSNAAAVAEASVGDEVAVDADIRPIATTRDREVPQGTRMPPLLRSSSKGGAGVLHFFRAWEPSARRYAAGAVAATILLAVFGWMVFRTPHRPGVVDPPTPHSSPDPLLASIVRQDLRLAKVNEPSERFLVLADLADDLSGEVKNLAPVPEAKGVLDDLVKRYEEVVRNGLLKVAKKLPDQKLPAKERDDLLNTVGERLQVAGRTAEELGDALGAKIPNSSREALRRLTRAARQGDNQLRELRVQNLQQEPGNGRAIDHAVLVRRNSP